MRRLIRFVGRIVILSLCLPQWVRYSLFPFRPKVKISIVILTWNRARLLKQAIDSILNNISGTISYELIVMDNGSTDETQTILQPYAGRKEIRLTRLPKNGGLNSFKKIFALARGEIIVAIDDDVIQAPKDFDITLLNYLNHFPDYGYIALNVIQNEMTDGARPIDGDYTDDVRGEYVIERGPTEAWFSAFRNREYLIFRHLFNLFPIRFPLTQDGVMVNLMISVFRKKSGLVKNTKCLHACGPFYAREYGYLAAGIEKYATAGILDQVEKYRQVAQSAEALIDKQKQGPESSSS